MKKAMALVFAAALLLSLLCACGAPKEESPAVGTWNGVYGKFVGDENKVTDEEFTLVLKSDGTGTHYRDDLEIDVTWELDGENFKMTETYIGTIDYTGTLKGDELSIFNGDPANDLTYQYVYARAAEAGN